jgi:hypothetical protein
LNVIENNNEYLIDENFDKNDFKKYQNDVLEEFNNYTKEYENKDDSDSDDELNESTILNEITFEKDRNDESENILPSDDEEEKEDDSEMNNDNNNSILYYN